eukprot:5533953-Prymnesium_polylepis.1
MLLPNWPLLNQPSTFNLQPAISNQQSAISHQPSANQPSSIPVRNRNPPVVDATTELATAPTISTQSAINQSAI